MRLKGFVFLGGCSVDSERFCNKPTVFRDCPERLKRRSLLSQVETKKEEPEALFMPPV